MAKKIASKDDPAFKSGSQSTSIGRRSGSDGSDARRVFAGQIVSRDRWGRSRAGASASREDLLFEEMLQDPTIRLAVDVVVAMMLRVPWSAEGEDAERSRWIVDQIEPYRETIVRSSLRGMLRDGWRSFEVAYAIDEETDLYGVAGIKALRRSLTAPMVYSDTGQPAGVETTDENGSRVVIDELHSFTVNFDDEGFGDLGEPLLRVAKGPHLKWEDSDDGARRYDKKVAGGFILVQYPVGEINVAPAGAEPEWVDQAAIAERVARNFESAGYACVPRLVDPDSGKPLDSPWLIEHVAASGGLQPNFVVRAKYLDALKLRAFGIPERSTTEGTFGTKAESESHADIALIVNLDRLSRIVDAVNKGPVAAMCEANDDDKHSTKLVLGKLDPQDRELFASIFTSLMSDPVFGEEIASKVDTELLLDKLNVPVLSQEELSVKEDASFEEEELNDGTVAS